MRILEDNDVKRFVLYSRIFYIALWFIYFNLYMRFMLVLYYGHLDWVLLLITVYVVACKEYLNYIILNSDVDFEELEKQIQHLRDTR